MRRVQVEGSGWQAVSSTLQRCPRTGDRSTGHCQCGSDPEADENTSAASGSIDESTRNSVSWHRPVRGFRGDQRTAQILQDLHTAVEQIAQSGRIEQWLDAMATDGLRRWSANNRLIALLQLHDRAKGRPELLEDVHMMSFRQWDKQHGRRVMKGERAIWILAPRTRRVEG
jgi:hypothetical protein